MYFNLFYGQVLIIHINYFHMKIVFLENLLLYNQQQYKYAVLNAFNCGLKEN